MLVIQHRVNSPELPILSECVEIDVHNVEGPALVVKHNEDVRGISLAQYMACSKREKFFVDIKQNLRTETLEYITFRFGDKLIGLFDVPFPSCFYAAKAGLPVYRRISEYESNDMCTAFTKFWIDPLLSWKPETYDRLIRKNIMYGDIIIACPSLHGQPLEVCKEVWEYLAQRSDIQGIVTKHVEACKGVVGEDS